jgi:hypothetical protein
LYPCGGAIVIIPSKGQGEGGCQTKDSPYRIGFDGHIK